MSASVSSMLSLTSVVSSESTRPTARYERHLTTRLGVLELKMPRTRTGQFRTKCSNLISNRPQACR